MKIVFFLLLKPILFFVAYNKLTKYNFLATMVTRKE